MKKLSTEEEIERLGDAEEKLSSILDSIAGIHWWKDKNGVYRGCNQAMVNALGLEAREDIIGKTDYDLPWSDQADELVANDNIVMETGIVQHGKEEYVRSNDGKLRVFMVAKSPLRNHRKEIIGTVGNSIDITLQKELEQELEIAKEKAEAADLKTKFIQNMQHDVRTPLAGVYGYMKELAVEETDPEKKKLAQYMAASTGQLLNMCNELVDFENIDYLGDIAKLEAVDIIRFLSKTIDINKMAAHHRSLELTLLIDPSVPAYLKLDKKKLYRVLVNLIGNSLKFTDKGSVTLQVKTLAVTADAATVIFEIRDTGMGIPADKIDLIFDKFVRLNPSNAAKYKGSGLGLYYVKKFVDDMHGKLEVESIEGNGSIFRIILNLFIACAEEVEAASPHEVDTFDEDIVQHEVAKFPDERFNKKSTSSITTSTESPTTNIEDTTKPNILIIEDDIILQKTISKTFKNIGCNIAALTNSVPTACAAIKAQAYDLVVCDLGLIEGSGIDVINWVKQDKSHPNQETPFVVLTANHDNMVKKKALDCGFLSIFQKPLAEIDAQKIIDTYVHGKTTSLVINDIIDINASLEIVGDMALVCEVFGMLSRSLLEDKQKLQDYYTKNDIAETRKILHRLDGTFRSCVVPALQHSRGVLHEAVRNTQDLATITELYGNFYNDIDVFLATYIKWKTEGIL